MIEDVFVFFSSETNLGISSSSSKSERECLECFAAFKYCQKRISWKITTKRLSRKIAGKIATFEFHKNERRKTLIHYGYNFFCSSSYVFITFGKYFWFVANSLKTLRRMTQQILDKRLKRMKKNS